MSLVLSLNRGCMLPLCFLYLSIQTGPTLLLIMDEEGERYLI